MFLLVFSIPAVSLQLCAGFTVRSLFAVVVPVDEELQLLCLATVLGPSVVVCAGTLPWRIYMANMLDITANMGFLLILFLVALDVEVFNWQHACGFLRVYLHALRLCSCKSFSRRSCAEARRSNFIVPSVLKKVKVSLPRTVAEGQG